MKRDYISKPQQKPPVDYRSHCEALLGLIRKTNMAFHPNDEAKLKRIVEDIDNG